MEQSCTVCVHNFVELLKEELNSSHEKDVERVRSESKELVEQTRKALSSELEQRELEVCPDQSLFMLC